MKATIPRRSFIRGAVGAASLAALEQAGILRGLPMVTAAEARLSPGSVRFRPEIEPLVRLIEGTSRERLIEEVAARVRTGTSYRDVLAALLLAGVRNIQPRPVGFKFHAVLVVNSAHLASQNSPDADRWLPIFWALDQFKSSQVRDVQEGDWTMSAVNEAAVPEGSKARISFQRSMDRWDVEGADAAVAGFARTAGAQEVFDVFCRYGARDFRDIGHKAIFVANSWRTLQTIGWKHAEPVLRSLAYALLEHEAGIPSGRDAEPDRPGRRHAELVKEFREGWLAGAMNADATRDLTELFRDCNWEQAGARVVRHINRGVHTQSVWDAVFSAAGEMLMRKPGIVTLHACTTMNALHYAFQNVSGDETRRFLLLQAAAFIPMFRSSAGSGVERGVRLEDVEPEMDSAKDPLEAIFVAASGDKMAATRKALGWLKSSKEAGPLIAAAQRWIYMKGTDSHDYKFSSAVFEDYANLSPGVRDRYLAASVHWLKGSRGPDSPLVPRTRAALALT